MSSLTQELEQHPEALGILVELAIAAGGDPIPAWRNGAACKGMSKNAFDADALELLQQLGLVHVDKTGGCYITRRGWHAEIGIRLLGAANEHFSMANACLLDAARDKC